MRKEILFVASGVAGGKKTEESISEGHHIVTGSGERNKHFLQ